MVDKSLFDISLSPHPCTWRLGTTEPSPHIHQSFYHPRKICDNVLEAMGNTPMVRINHIKQQENIQCELLAKCEFLNPGGSVKDRIGARMVLDAEAKGRIKPGDTLIEPTSGNTGIGLAVACASKGYKCIVTMPEKMSQEKSDTLKVLGAEIIRTPTEAAFDSPESHIGVALRLNNELPNSHILDQYSNPSNPIAHYDQTAEEILYQCDGKVDYVVISAGTGGTIAGISRKLKERLPDVKIVGVDPDGSILAQPQDLNGPIKTYAVEGIGYDFVPRVCYRETTDFWMKSHDHESFAMARRLIKEEGLLCGGSSGSAMHAAVQLAKTLPADQRVVVILPDSIRNYMTKFISDKWMIELGFMEPPNDRPALAGKVVSDIQLQSAITITPEVPCSEALNIMSTQGFDQLPVVDNEKVVGVVTVGGTVSKLATKRVSVTDPCSKIMYPGVKLVSPSTPLEKVSVMFETHSFLIVQDESSIYILSPIDVAKYMASLEQ